MMNESMDKEKEHWDRGEWKTFVLACVSFAFFAVGSLASFPYRAGEELQTAIGLGVVGVMMVWISVLVTYRQVRSIGKNAKGAVAHLSMWVGSGLVLSVIVGLSYQVAFTPEDVTSWYVMFTLGMATFIFSCMAGDLMDGLERLPERSE